MKILFIGGTGVLSTDIVKLSLRRGHDVYLLNRGSHRSEIPTGCRLIVGDIRDARSCRENLSGHKFDVVADFLSFTPDQLQSTIDITEDICTQYIFISSACSYRREATDFPIEESSPQPNRNLPYGVGKYDCERLLRSCKRRFGYTIVRPYITYGDTRIPFGIAPQARYHWTIIARILAGKPLFYWNENGHVPRCNLTHTRDFAVGFCGLFLNPDAYNEDFNIVGDESCSWREMVGTLYDVLGVREREIIDVPAWEIAATFAAEKDFFKGDRNLDAIFDNTKIKKIVPEFRTTITLREGMAATVDCYRAHDHMGGIDYRYDALCDRLLSRYVRGLHFVDYLGDASRSQEIKYMMYRYMGDRGVRFLSRLKNSIGK